MSDFVDQPPNVCAQPALVTAVVQIVRANTGKVENYTLTFYPLPEQQNDPKQRED